jgi:hypothetical protein
MTAVLLLTPDPFICSDQLCELCCSQAILLCCHTQAVKYILNTDFMATAVWRGMEDCFHLMNFIVLHHLFLHLTLLSVLLYLRINITRLPLVWEIHAKRTGEVSPSCILFCLIKYIRLDSGAVIQRARWSSMDVPEPHLGVVWSIPGPPKVLLLRIWKNTVKLPLGLYNSAPHHEDAWGRGGTGQQFLILALYEAG